MILKKLMHTKLRSLNNALGGLVIVVVVVVCLFVAVVTVNLKYKHNSLFVENMDFGGGRVGDDIH